MKQNRASLQPSPTEQPGRGTEEAIALFPGIELSYFTLTAAQQLTRRAAPEHTLEIHYCRAGRLGWDLGSGNSVYLGETDYSLHSWKGCSEPMLSLPTNHCEGLSLRLDLRTLTERAPELLSASGVTGESLSEKFCTGSAMLSFAGDERTESIFSGFFGHSEPLRLSYQKIKAVELLLYLSELEPGQKGQLTEYQSEQVEAIRRIHSQLMEHMDQRFTIEALAKQYLMNPTTLKALFKSVYGVSIAAHMKQHRMEQAARLLRETDLRVAEVAGQVGYDSQSKFTAAFKDAYHTLPTEYRKQQRA